MTRHLILDKLFPIRNQKTIDTAKVMDTDFSDSVTSVSGTSDWKPYATTMQTAFTTFVQPYLSSIESLNVDSPNAAETMLIQHLKNTIALYTYAVDLPKRLFSTGNAGVTTANVDKQTPVDMGKFKVQAQAAVLAADRALDALIAYINRNSALETFVPHDRNDHSGIADFEKHVPIDNSVVTYVALLPYWRSVSVETAIALSTVPSESNILAYNQIESAYIAQRAFVQWLKTRQSSILIESNGFRILSNMAYLNHTTDATNERQLIVNEKIKALESDNALKYSALRRLLASPPRPNASTVWDGQSNVFGIYQNRR